MGENNSSSMEHVSDVLVDVEASPPNGTVEVLTLFRDCIEICLRPSQKTPL
jgi:hypothetical protein